MRRQRGLIGEVDGDTCQGVLFTGCELDQVFVVRHRHDVVRLEALQSLDGAAESRRVLDTVAGSVSMAGADIDRIGLCVDR